MWFYRSLETCCDIGEHSKGREKIWLCLHVVLHHSVFIKLDRNTSKTVLLLLENSLRKHLSVTLITVIRVLLLRDVIVYFLLRFRKWGQSEYTFYCMSLIILFFQSDMKSRIITLMFLFLLLIVMTHFLLTIVNLC